jgi:hypothetical protein
MSKTMSLRLTDRQLSSVEKWRRRFNQRSTSAALQLLLEEKLREEEYTHISFRDSAAGREAYLMGTGLAVWEVALVNGAYHGDIAQTAEHLGIPETLVHAALNYANDFQQEIGAELAEIDATDFDALRRLLPGIRQTTVPDEFEIGPGAVT